MNKIIQVRNMKSPSSVDDEELPGDLELLADDFVIPMPKPVARLKGRMK